MSSSTVFAGESKTSAAGSQPAARARCTSSIDAASRPAPLATTRSRIRMTGFALIATAKGALREVLMQFGDVFVEQAKIVKENRLISCAEPACFDCVRDGAHIERV